MPNLSIRALVSAVLLPAASLLCASLALAQHAPAGGALPAGPGSEIVSVACTQCHSPNAFGQLRQGPEAWRRQVQDMILRGAQIHPDEMDTVVKYLSAQFGPGINVPPALLAGSLPEGTGRALVEQQCSLCHGLDRVVSARRSASEWDAIVGRMRALGSPASGDEARIIADYLKAQVGLR